MNSQDKRLGRGLSALLGDEAAEPGAEAARATRQLPTSALRPSRFQPRRRFDPEEMASLVRSVQAQGILQPILVRHAADSADSYEIIAGERRWRAAQEAQLHEVPVIVKDLSDGEALELALVENLQRTDLTPLEEAEGYRRLIAELNHTQEDLARAIGKSRSHIANTMRLLGLPAAIKEMIERGELTAGHARALLNAQDALALAQQVVEGGLNVRQTERLAQAPKARGPAPAAPAKDADTLALEHDLALKLGLKVTINHRAGGGELVLRYENLAQLDDLVQRLSRDPGRF
jgi:ParB family transcriptional regulator, chromosome partitioning protein